MGAATVSDSNQGLGISHSKDSYEKKQTRFKKGVFTVPTATTSADTVSVDIEENFGITRLMGFRGFQHTTENSVIEQEEDDSESTIAMTNNTLTVTINGTSSACKRVYVVYGL